MSRHFHRDRLAAMSDEALLAECVRCISDYRRNQNDRDLRAMSELCRDECIDRGKRDEVWLVAVAREQEQERAKGRITPS